MGSMLVSRKQILTYLADNPRQSTRQLATHFDIAYDHLWDRFRAMEEEGYVFRSEQRIPKARGGTKALIVWEVSKVQPVRIRIDWLKKDEQTLVQIYPYAMPDELRAAFPGRSLLAIRKKAEGMGIKRHPGVVSKLRAVASRKAHFIRHAQENVPMQTIIRGPAPVRDDGIVVKAIQQRTALEMAWGGHV